MFFANLPASAQTPLASLLAEKPSEKNRDQLMLFGQFVGQWEFEGVEYREDGSRGTDKGEIHFGWVLQGRAVQDVWMEHERSDKGPLVYGTTVRFYDPGIDAWRMTWLDPVNGSMRALTGRKVADEIVLESKGSDGTQIRWIFSQIKPDSFHWRGEKLTGEKWRVYEELNARRKK
jgi:hypothetical protein